MATNLNRYPFWYPPEQSGTPTNPQKTGRVLANNQIPLQNGVHTNVGVVASAPQKQDTRRVGQADKEILGVGDPGYLFQRVMNSTAPKEG